VAISFGIAVLSTLFVLSQIVMKGFNDFYFGPHKSFPYPYRTVTDAQIATWLKCGATFLIVFTILYLLQRRLTSAKRT
jgi:hypothetical protein